MQVDWGHSPLHKLQGPPAWWGGGGDSHLPPCSPSEPSWAYLTKGAGGHREAKREAEREAKREAPRVLRVLRADLPGRPL